MTKFIAREKEVVDAYQFTGGEREGKALAKLINTQTHASASWQSGGYLHERIRVVGDTFADNIRIGEWVLFRENGSINHLTNDQFEAKYEKIKQPRRKLIWKDIPGFQNYQVSDTGSVRDVRFHGYSRRTKDGTFNLYVNGEKHKWSESQIGDKDQIKAFFNS